MARAPCGGSRQQDHLLLRWQQENRGHRRHVQGRGQSGPVDQGRFCDVLRRSDGHGEIILQPWIGSCPNVVILERGFSSKRLLKQADLERWVPTGFWRT